MQCYGIFTQLYVYEVFAFANTEFWKKCHLSFMVMELQQCNMELTDSAVYCKL